MPDGVLVTRPHAEAAATAARLRAMGLSPVAAPLLTVTPRPFHVPTHDAVLVTSGNALPSLAGLSAPLLAVGDSTAARASAAGFSDVRSAGGDATDLLALARRLLPPGAVVLLPSAAGQGRALAASLRAAGFRVHRRTAYRARPVRRFPDAAAEALRAGTLRAVLFLSAETARTFVHLLPPALRPALAEVEALAIGPPAATVLAPLPWRRIRVPLSPTLESLLGLL